MRQKIIPILFLFLAGLLLLVPINASDFYHHIATGRYIFQTHSLPYTDTFSFTATGLPWVAHSWGTGLLYFGIYTLFGPIGISFFTAIIGVLCAIVLLKISVIYKIPTRISYPVTALSLAVMSLRWPTRPEILAPLFLVTTIYLLLKYSKPTFLLIPLFWMWGICYGSSVFLGIGLLGWYAITHCSLWKRMVPMLLLCFFASLLNDYGFSSFLYIFQIPAIAAHTGEWLPLLSSINPQNPILAFSYQYIVLSYILFTITIIGILMASIITQRQKILHALFPLGPIFAVVAPFITIRFINVVPILTAPFLFYSMSILRPKIRKIFAIIIAILAIIIMCVRFGTTGTGFGEEWSSGPFTFLTIHNLSGNIFTTQELGSVAIWRLPTSRVYVDTRDDLYAKTDIFTELSGLSTGKLSIQQVLDTRQINIVIASVAEGGLYKSLPYSTNWNLVYIENGYAIYVRSDIAAKNKLVVYQSINPFRIPPAKPGMNEEAVNELERILKNNPKSQETTMQLAEVLSTINRANEAFTLASSLPVPQIPFLKLPLVMVSTNERLISFAIQASICNQALKLLNQQTEIIGHLPLLFTPTVHLPSQINLFWGEYYTTCDKNPGKAKQYYRWYLQKTNDPLEIRHIETMLNAL